MQVRASQIRSMLVLALQDESRLDMLPKPYRKVVENLDLDTDAFVNAMLDHFAISLAQDLLRLQRQRTDH